MSSEFFSLAVELPGPATTTVIEASAGTGKTYAIAGLVARFVASGRPLRQILAVTFSRMATAELREGIRARLVRSRDVLRSGQPTLGDPIDEWLLTDDALSRADRLELFETALGDIDSAAIVTLHTFAKRMLDELGLLADHDRATELGDDLEVLADEVVRDCYLSDPLWQELSWAYASVLGRAALDHRSEALHPVRPETALRTGFAQQVRAEFDRRKRRRQVMDYDDMVDRLTATLTDPITGARAAAVLSTRFPVVLVDEFQDTDPQQWEFLQHGFDGRSTVMLIGDPKQAIYRFRGGDIETYTRARDSAGSVQTMTRNFRSDEPVVRGIEAVFGQANMGSATAPIVVHPVQVQHEGSRLSGPGGRVRVRLLDENRTLNSWLARQHVTADVVGQVVGLLNGSHELREASGRSRALRAGDIAVLVTANYYGRQVHRALADAGIPAVFSGSSSVYASPAAADWLTLLEAMQDSSSFRLRRAMLTDLIGWSSVELAAATGDELIDMTALIARCARLLVDQGVTAVFETLVAERDIHDRLLALPDGEGLVTDLRHLSEILNEAQARQALSASGLAEFLRRRIKRASDDTVERARRMPTDRPAVQILTVHQAKGLQFPVVLLPQAFDGHGADLSKDLPLVGHLDGRRILDVASPDQRPDQGAGYAAEDLAEDLRKFYVAATRAQSLLIAWWAPTTATTPSALHRLLMNAGAGAVPDADPLLARVRALPQPAGVDFEYFDPAKPAPRPAATIERASTEPKLLDARVFRDRIDREWTRTSYSGLTAQVHGQPLLGFDEPDVADPDAESTPLDAQLSTLDRPSSALADLPGGVVFGSLVHAILETVDPAAPDLPAVLMVAASPLLERFPLPGLDANALVAGLEQTLTTPLGRLTGGRSLRELGAQHRLAELDFELPLGSGTNRSRVADLADLFAGLSASDPLRRYGQQLADSPAAGGALAGFLTGSIDVVLQVPDAQPRYLILDYKTNRVPAAADEVLTAHHYSPTAMTTAMCEAHYPLQALLYSVALHRYLRWRLPGYDPEQHLGGVGYLFVRGMVGADNPMIGTMPAGVFTWTPPASMILAASAVLAGGQR